MISSRQCLRLFIVLLLFSGCVLCLFTCTYEVKHGTSAGGKTESFNLSDKILWTELFYSTNSSNKKDSHEMYFHVTQVLKNILWHESPPHWTILGHWLYCTRVRHVKTADRKWVVWFISSSCKPMLGEERQADHTATQWPVSLFTKCHLHSFFILTLSDSILFKVTLWLNQILVGFLLNF